MALETFLDIIERDRLFQLREKVEKKDDYLGECMKNAKKQLCEGLSQEQVMLVNHFELAVANKYDNEHYYLEQEILNLAFRLGMEMQRAFDEEEFDIK